MVDDPAAACFLAVGELTDVVGLRAVVGSVLASGTGRRPSRREGALNRAFGAAQSPCHLLGAQSFLLIEGGNRTRVRCGFGLE